jgi:hypothetical protein
MFLKKVTSSCFLMLLCACSSTQQTAEAPQSREDKIKLGFGSLAGPEGITLGSDKISGRTNDSAGYVVNSYLWKASLDTLKFAPLVSSDGPGINLQGQKTALKFRCALKTVS